MTGIIDVQTPRAKPRRKLFQPVTLVRDGVPARAHLLDLSTTGAQVHATAAPASGAQVLVECAGARRMARVVWVRGGRFGVVFAVPLTAGEVETAVAAASG